MSESNFHFNDSFMTAMKKVVDGKPMCTGCSTRFFTHKDLESHMKYCEVKKKSESELLPADRPSCNICGLVFISEFDLNNHKLTHKETPFECEICEKRFQKRVSYDKHLRTHPDSDFCQICKRQFSSVKDYLNHKREEHHTESYRDYSTPGRYVCIYCHKHFSESRTLKEHVHQVHKDEHEKCQQTGTSSLNLGVFMCDACNRRFSTYSELREHTSYHHERVKTEGVNEENDDTKSEPVISTAENTTSEDHLGLQIDETSGEAVPRDTPPQLSPVTSLSETTAAQSPPPALEAVDQEENKTNMKLLPTQKFAKGHDSPRLRQQLVASQDRKTSCLPSSSNVVQTKATKTSNSKTTNALSKSAATTVRKRQILHSTVKSSPVVQKASVINVSPEKSNTKSSESSRPPSAVWLRHLEKMKNIMSKQKQYEQQMHLKKLDDSDLKLISELKKKSSDKPNSEEPTEKRLKLTENLEKSNTKVILATTSSKEHQNVKYKTLAPQASAKHNNIKYAQISMPNTNGTLAKSPRKLQQPISAKEAQKLQREKERRERFIKKHEDLLNQELVEGEIPAEVLNDEADESESGLEIEVKLGDGSTAVLDLPSDS